MGFITWLVLEYSEFDMEYEKFGISKIYGEINKKYFSQAYDIDSFSNVNFKLMDIHEGSKFYSIEKSLSPLLRQLQQCYLELLYVKMRVGNDRLYLKNETWKVFRDAGILTECEIQIKIEQMVSAGIVVQIFPTRDVVS
jgi:hypothetical protein